jgi:hypothetical protein
VDVTISGGGRRGKQNGILLHRTTMLLSDEIRERHGIPVTAPLRTLIDLAGCAEDAEGERAVAEAFADTPRRGRSSATAERTPT